MDKKHFQELLERARKNLAAAKEQEAVDEAKALAIQIEEGKVTHVDMTQAGISDESLKTPEGEEAAVDVIREIVSVATEGSTSKTYGVAKEVILNIKQQEFNIKVQTGDDCVLIGAAGTGKTTSMRRVTEDLISSGRLRPLQAGTKWLQQGKPGAAILSYTRKAVNNIRHAVVEELKQHTITIHKLLEFAPIFYEIVDEEKPGSLKKTMRFEPTRNATNPLPPDLILLAFEESSMISVELYRLLQEAMPHEHQEIFLGDIQQLPPIFGMAILGFKMLELPVIELTEVYRQALESPIINLAWKILEGNPHEFSGRTETREVYSELLGRNVLRKHAPVLDRYTVKSPSGEVTFKIWQKKLSADHGLLTAVKQFTTWEADGCYNPQDDIILCPFNKAFGTIELNKGIAQYLGVKRATKVYEVIAGFNKHYLAVGDRVLYDKEDAYITSINHNGNYLGQRPQPASIHLDRWGHLREEMSVAETMQAEEVAAEMDLKAIEDFMNAAVEQADEKVNAASHVITVKLAYGEGEEISLDQAGEINNLLGGYAITVHKAQGSEWDRVFFIMHNTHAVMTNRELLYTAVTRAKRFLYIIAETDTFEKGIKSQHIKGNTIRDKAAFFKGKAMSKSSNGEFDIEWTKKHVKHLAVTFQPGEYQGPKKDEVSIVTPEEHKPVTLIKLCDLVPEGVKYQAKISLDHWWLKATNIWGQVIEPKPVLDYNLQVSSKLGQAHYHRNLLQLNPVWMIATLKSQKLFDEMMNVTIPHEVAHFVNLRFSRGTGHDSGWEMAMKLLGLPAEVTYKGDDLPPWAKTYKEIIEETKKELAAKNADLSETEE